jgi:hypothetical protein
MPIKILCAGFAKEEKASLENNVRRALTARPPQEAWTISVVRSGSKLQVTVDGPDERLRAKNFVVEPAELQAALSDVMARNGFGGPGAVPSAPARAAVASYGAPVHTGGPRGQSHDEPGESYEWEAPPPPGERRDTHRCPNCTQSYVVTYESGSNEPRQLVSVACPHCWKLDRVEVSENAAIAREYRAHKLTV